MNAHKVLDHNSSGIVCPQGTTAMLKAKMSLIAQGRLLQAQVTKQTKKESVVTFRPGKMLTLVLK